MATLNAALYGLLAAIANANSAFLSKALTNKYAARQLIGPIYIAHTLVLLPAAAFVTWRWSPEILVLHLASVGLVAVTAITFMDMLAAGATSSTTTASAISPIATTLGVAILVPGAFRPIQAIAAVIVTSGVLYALRDAFSELGRRGTAFRIIGNACGAGLLTVCARLLGDAGVGVVETYIVRTFVVAAIFMIAVPPKDVPLREAPRLLGRSLVVVTGSVLVIMGAQSGSPVVVQTLLATTPVFVIGWQSLQERMVPPAREIVAAAIVIVGVVVTLG